MHNDLNIDLMDPEVQKCPYEAYASLRRECPVYQMPSTGQYVVSTYSELQEVLRRPDVFSNQMPLKNRRPGGPNLDVAGGSRRQPCSARTRRSTSAIGNILTGPSRPAGFASWHHISTIWPMN